MVLLILVAVAAIVWGRNILLVFSGTVGDKGSLKQSVNRKIVDLVPSSYQYTDDFRDPFFCTFFMTPEKVKGESGREIPKKTRAVPVNLPACTIGGIVYNEKNPMVLLNVSGKSVMAKQGETIDSIRVKKIGKDSVWVVYKGKVFGLGK